MSEVRTVHCVKLDKDLPGLPRPPYKNDLGKRLYEQVSKEAWDMWLKDSVKFINTYRVDLTSADGQKFMFKQCAIYFGFEEGEMAQTAFVPAEKAGHSHGHDHAHGHDHGHDHGTATDKKEG